MNVKRKRIGKRRSKKLFRRTSGIHIKNVAPAPMRGGYRM